MTKTRRPAQADEETREMGLQLRSDVRLMPDTVDEEARTIQTMLLIEFPDQQPMENTP